MQDFALTFDTEAQAIAALPEYRSQSEDGEQWAGSIIPNATRWIQRPQYDADGNVTTSAETVPGWHCMIRAESIPKAAQSFIVEPGDIEPVFAGSWKHAVVPQSVEALYALLAIDDLGYTQMYETWASDPARTFKEKAFIDKAGYWRRDDVYFNAAADDMGLGETDKDVFFRHADSLRR